MTGFSEVPRPIAAAEWDHLERTLETLIDKSTRVALAGSLPPGARDDAYARLVNEVHRAGGGVVVDTHGDRLTEAVAAKLDIVKVSVAEAAELLGATLSNAPVEALEAAHEIRRRGAPTPTGHFPCVVITFRGRGALALTPDDSGIVIEPPAIGPYRAGSGERRDARRRPSRRRPDSRACLGGAARAPVKVDFEHDGREQCRASAEPPTG